MPEIRFDEVPVEKGNQGCGEERKAMSEMDKRIIGDQEAAMRYAKLADAAQSAKMRAYWNKCAMEAATSAAINCNLQAETRPHCLK